LRSHQEYMEDLSAPSDANQQGIGNLMQSLVPSEALGHELRLNTPQFQQKDLDMSSSCT